MYLLLLAIAAGKICQLNDLRPGFFDHETGRLECAENPFAAKLLPMRRNKL